MWSFQFIWQKTNVRFLILNVNSDPNFPGFRGRIYTSEPRFQPSIRSEMVAISSIVENLTLNVSDLVTDRFMLEDFEVFYIQQNLRKCFHKLKNLKIVLDFSQNSKLKTLVSFLHHGVVRAPKFSVFGARSRNRSHRFAIWTENCSLFKSNRKLSDNTAYNYHIPWKGVSESMEPPQSYCTPCWLA